MLVMANLSGRIKAGNQLHSQSFYFRICRLLLLLVVPLALTPPASIAQSDSLPAASLAFAAASIPTIDRHVQEVNLILTVTNNRGRFVRNLSESDFDILDNGQSPDRITFFQPQTNLPLRVALALDISDSVTYRFNFEQKAAAAFFRHVLHAPADLGSVVAFNQEPRIVQDPTHSTKDLDAALRRLHPGGETSLYDAVILAARQMSTIQDQQPSRHAIIVISDGEDNHSHAHLQEAADAALRSDSIVYVVSTNARDFEVGLAGDGDTAMKQLAEATGGRILHAETDGEVASAFAKIEKELRSQYAIGYKPASKAPDGLFHRLVVVGPKKLRIFHRVGYFAR